LESWFANWKNGCKTKTIYLSHSALESGAKKGYTAGIAIELDTTKASKRIEIPREIDWALSRCGRRTVIAEAPYSVHIVLSYIT